MDAAAIGWAIGKIYQHTWDNGEHDKFWMLRLKKLSDEIVLNRFGKREKPMDYERKYKEALERAKKYRDEENFTEMEDVFPELKESEDERIRKTLLRYYSSKQAAYPYVLDAAYGTLATKDIVAWLEKQKEQKPVEWSEEDENMRNNILRVLNAFVGTVGCESDPSLSTSFPLYLREMDWLKSLRPSWKPSKEQIYSLGTAVKGLSDVTVGSVGYNLKELYEQLKEL